MHSITLNQNWKGQFRHGKFSTGYYFVLQLGSGMEDNELYEWLPNRSELPDSTHEELFGQFVNLCLL